MVHLLPCRLALACCGHAGLHPESLTLSSQRLPRRCSASSSAPTRSSIFQQHSTWPQVQIPLEPDLDEHLPIPIPLSTKPGPTHFSDMRPSSRPTTSLTESLPQTPASDQRPGYPSKMGRYGRIKQVRVKSPHKYLSVKKTVFWDATPSPIFIYVRFCVPRKGGEKRIWFGCFSFGKISDWGGQNFLFNNASQHIASLAV
jgi:hypothetical protein